jgi:hypothetical protein
MGQVLITWPILPVHRLLRPIRPGLKILQILVTPFAKQFRMSG